MPRYVVAVVTVLNLAAISSVAAQSGAPGSQLESGRDHRATVRAEAYLSATTFLTKWLEVWQKGDAAALTRLYTDDAAVRLPGQAIVRTRTPIDNVLRTAAASASPIEFSHLDFHTDGELAILVSCYSTRQENRELKGLVTTVMLRSSRSWRIRLQMFDLPHPAGVAHDLPPC